MCGARVECKQATARDANIITHMIFAIILIFIVLNQLLRISLYTRKIFHSNKVCNMLYFSSFLYLGLPTHSETTPSEGKVTVEIHSTAKGRDHWFAAMKGKAKGLIYSTGVGHTGSKFPFS